LKIAFFGGGLSTIWVTISVTISGFHDCKKGTPFPLSVVVNFGMIGDVNFNFEFGVIRPLTLTFDFGVIARSTLTSAAGD